MAELEKTRNKIWLWLGVALLVVLIGVYAVLSVQAWNRNDQAVREAKSKYQSQVKTLKSSKSIDQRRAIVTALSTDTKNDDLCNVKGWYAWQRQAIGGLKQQIDRCNKIKRQIKDTNDAAKPINAFLHNEKNLRIILEGLNPGKKTLTEKTWSDAQKKMQQAEKTIKTQMAEGGADYQEVKQAALKSIGEINKSWRTLDKANAAKDKEAYLAAVDALDLRYSQLQSISEASDTALKRLLEKLQATL